MPDRRPSLPTGSYLEQNPGQVGCRGVPQEPKIEREYKELADVCRELKRYLTVDDIDPETVKLVEENCPDGEWGSDAG